MIFLENSGEGRRYRFHGAFGSLDAADRKAGKYPGAFVRETMIGGRRRYVVMTPKPARRNPTAGGRSGHSTRKTGGSQMAAKRSRRRKGAARRKARRSHARVVHHNAPRATHRRRRSGKRRTMHRNSSRRRSFRRNPPGLVAGLMDAAVDGAKVTAGVLAQNGVVRYVPDLLPATMPNAAMLNPLIKDVGGVILGAYAFDRMFGRDSARFVVAGQAHAAIARILRAANVPVVSGMLGEYDPIRLGTYARGIATRTVKAIAPPKNNVDTLKGIGIYTDGMSSAPGLF